MWCMRDNCHVQSHQRPHTSPFKVQPTFDHADNHPFSRVSILSSWPLDPGSIPVCRQVRQKFHPGYKCHSPYHQGPCLSIRLYLVKSRKCVKVSSINPSLLKNTWNVQETAPYKCCNQPFTCLKQSHQISELNQC